MSSNLFFLWSSITFGYTQIKVAEHLSVTPQAVSKWETDTAYPDITLIVSIAELLDISTDDLLGHANAAKTDINIRLNWHAFDFIREDERFKAYPSEAETW